MLRWTTSWDGYRFRGDYRYPLEQHGASAGIITNKEFDAGDWITTRLTYRFPILTGDLTAGGEGKFDLRALQSVADVLPVYAQRLSVNELDKAAAGFLQQEWNAGTKWSFTVGARYDWSLYRSSSISPRGGIIFVPNPRSTLKLTYGSGFRNPNANELFFADGTQNAGNRNLQPEKANSLEAAVYRNFAKSWTASISAYRTVDTGIIVPVFNSDGLAQFVNADSFHGIGLGAEISGNPLSFLQIDANFQRQQSWLENRTTLANSPRSLGKMRFSVPLNGSRLLLSGGVLYQSERQTLTGARLDPVWLPELTLVSKSLPQGFDVQVGVRNLSGARYTDPAGLNPGVDTIRQAGRTYFVTVTRNFGKT